MKKILILAVVAASLLAVYIAKEPIDPEFADATAPSTGNYLERSDDLADRTPMVSDEAEPSGGPDLGLQESQPQNLKVTVDSLFSKSDLTPSDQLTLHYVLSECFIFAESAQRGERATRDEWLVAFNEAPTSVRLDALNSFDRCESFLNISSEEFLSYFGTAGKPKSRDWLENASAGGDPVARSLLAGELITSDGPRVAEGTALLVDAAISANAEAVKNISMYLGNKSIVKKAAWTFTACSFGYDCSPDSDLLATLCYLPRGCAVGQSPIDVLEFHLDRDALSDANKLSASIVTAIENKDRSKIEGYVRELVSSL